MSENLKRGEQNATLRSVVLGVGSVVVVAITVSFFYPKVPARPQPLVTAAADSASPPTAATSAQETPASAPAEEASAAASSQEASASPESSSAAESSPLFASAGASSANAAGETAAVPVSEPHRAHAVRRVKKVVAHYARATSVAAATPAPTPADAPADVPDDTVLPPPEPPLPHLSVVIGVRRAQAGLTSKNVAIGDLDISTHDGACQAMKRIRQAAAQVCPMEDGVGFSSLYDRRKCEQEAINSTLENMRRAKFDLPDKGC